MKEIFFEAFLGSNLIATGLLLFAVAYWIIVLLGMIDMDSLDVDIDLDADLDVEVNADVDIDNSGSAGVSWFNSVLIFFNLHNVPLMIFYSFLVLPLWVITVTINHYVGITSFSFSLIVLIPTFFFSLFIAKFATIPVSKVFANVEQNTESTNPIGKVCLVALPVKPSKIGQGIIKDLNGNVVRITIFGQKNQSINKGEKALVIEYDINEKAFLVEPYS